MSQENVELVRSVYAAWERGDWSPIEWADPEIEWVSADGPAPGTRTGLDGMAEGWRDWLSAWGEFRLEVNEYRDLDEERVLVLIEASGRGKTSGLELGQMGTRGSCRLSHPGRQGDEIRALVGPRPRARGLGAAGVGAMSRENVELVRRSLRRTTGGRSGAAAAPIRKSSFLIFAGRSGGVFRGSGGFTSTSRQSTCLASSRSARELLRGRGLSSESRWTARMGRRRLRSPSPSGSGRPGDASRAVHRPRRAQAVGSRRRCRRRDPTPDCPGLR